MIRKNWLGKILSVVITLVMAMMLTATAFGAEYTASKPAWVELDGVITSEEWGEPVLTGVTAQQIAAGEADDTTLYWDFSPAGEESFDLYVTNNDQFIYFGLVVHDTVIDADSTGYELWKYQNFTVCFGCYSPDTTVQVIDFDGQKWESYALYRFGMLADGTAKSECLTQGLNIVELYDQKDFSIAYDETAKTMTYEVAVPIQPVYTNVNLSADTKITFSAVVSLPYATNTASAAVNGSNRFVLGTAAALCGGPGNFAHPGNCSILTLNDLNAVSAAYAELEAETEAEPEVEPEPEAGAETETGEEPSVSAPEESAPEVTAPAPAQAGISNVLLLAVIIAGGVITAGCIVGTVLILNSVRKAKPADKEEPKDDVE